MTERTPSADGAPEPKRRSPSLAIPRSVRFRPSHRSLAWRVFLTNAAVLIGVSVFYVVTPATISSPVVITELLELALAITASLFLNLLLLARAFVPLDELRSLMERVDPLRPGQRVRVRHADADVAALAESFNTMLDRLEAERRESGRRELLAQEDERRRVARELHDQLGQTLTGVLLLVDEAARVPEASIGDVLAEAREATRKSIDEVRRIVRHLRPEALDDLGLPSAITAMASAFERQAGMALERRVDRIPPLTAEQELVVYRVAQEALTNVARHAEARRAALVVERQDGELRVAVSDDGRGFEGAPPEHGGIRGMHERALLVHGAVTIQSAAGRGTEVVLRLPL